MPMVEITAMPVIIAVPRKHHADTFCAPQPMLPSKNSWTIVANMDTKIAAPHSVSKKYCILDVTNQDITIIVKM